MADDKQISNLRYLRLPVDPLRAHAGLEEPDFAAAKPSPITEIDFDLHKHWKQILRDMPIYGFEPTHQDLLRRFIIRRDLHKVSPGIVSLGRYASRAIGTLLPHLDLSDSESLPFLGLGYLLNVLDKVPIVLYQPRNTFLSVVTNWASNEDAPLNNVLLVLETPDSLAAGLGQLLEQRDQLPGLLNGLKIFVKGGEENVGVVMEQFFSPTIAGLFNTIFGQGALMDVDYLGESNPAKDNIVTLYGEDIIAQTDNVDNVVSPDVTPDAAASMVVPPILIPEMGIPTLPKPLGV